MKNHLTLLGSAILILFSQLTKAQTSPVDSLKRYCTVIQPVEITNSNNFSIEPSSVKMSEYSTSPDEKGVEFAFEMLAIYHFSQKEIPNSDAAGITWGMVSKQLYSQSGLLSTEHLNLITTRNSERQPIFIVLSWDKQHFKWRVFTIGVSHIKTVRKGVRLFTM
jgi:hypothetical protein